MLLYKFILQIIFKILLMSLEKKFVIQLNRKFFSKDPKFLFVELGFEIAATPLKLTLPNNFCSTTLTVSGVPDEISAI